jgi:hypothetical protein
MLKSERHSLTHSSARATQEIIPLISSLPRDAAVYLVRHPLTAWRSNEYADGVSRHERISI